jgi:hypothetical protein
MGLKGKTLFRFPFLKLWKVKFILLPSLEEQNINYLSKDILLELGRDNTNFEYGQNITKTYTQEFDSSIHEELFRNGELLQGEFRKKSQPDSAGNYEFTPSSNIYNFDFSKISNKTFSETFEVNNFTQEQWRLYVAGRFV